jgi:hypothetical protein
MALKNVATTDTINTFRTTFNDLAIDVGDLNNLTTTATSNLVSAINEAAGSTNNFILRDETSSVSTINGGDTLNVVGSSGITATVSDPETLTISLDSTITGLTSITSTTITDGTLSINSGSISSAVNVTGSGTANFTTDVQVNSVSVATKPFAIAQAIALG